ncbi:FlaD/FlaE family flagellar protein [Halogeometricum luteum]|uniref:Flagellar protein E n=1 Tax=Halogeometricum luteum TaxID=2950537 RepID=A0ABU2FX36_9EURY|nr:FlaD/FlaE family flagellar protein [Halogeometricum sp. S3BR5-2]MDS0293092.1 flagellar protein E [Halogeometricum sp. S3BR5-2]
MGMTDWIHGEDEETRSEEEGTGLATDGLGFDEDLEDFGDDFGDFGDDLEGFDDEDEEYDEFSGGGAVDPDAIADLEDRVSDLENEVSATSSGMNTVREENKQIGETVEELDDTIRKLLDIYEMVTRGINPFVDDAREMGGLEGGGSFGLFEAEEEQEEHLDPAVASADAESFFDEDFGELDADEAAEEAELAAEDELAENERDDPAEILGEEDPIGGDEEEEEKSTAGGSSFDDLKAEYEEGDGWDEEDVDDGPLDADDLAVGDADVPTTEELLGEGDEADAEELDDGSVEETESDAGSFEFAETEAEPEATEAEATGADAAAQSAQDAGADTEAEATVDADADVYLATLPASYVAESVALEWTQFLVSVGGAIGAARALRQYREQEWISRPVERQMNAHVRNAASATTAEEPQDLRVEHHKESLTYVSRLAGDVAEALSHRGGTRGLRR